MNCATCDGDRWVPATLDENGNPVRVEPCPECRPELRARFLAGHLDPDHDRDECEECAALDPRRRRRAKKDDRQLALTPAPPQYRDFTEPEEREPWWET